MAFLREGNGLWSVLFGRKHLNISALVYWPKFGGGVIAVAFLRYLCGPL
jgi:hypothetical protein